LTLLTKAGIVLDWQTTLWAVLVLFFGQVVARENVQRQMGGFHFLSVAHEIGKSHNIYAIPKR